MMRYTFSGLTINFLSLDYDVGEEDVFVTIGMNIRETQIPFTLTLTPTTVDDVLADETFRAFDYIGESYSEIDESGMASPGENIKSSVDVCH